jgi:HD-GYP domain-containing protein (c-di-GMP phosphodiesterase class II)
MPRKYREDEHLTRAGQVPLFDMVIALSTALDLVHPDLKGHHLRTAYTAHAIASELGLPDATRAQIVLASALHDAGAVSLRERLDSLRFEFDDPLRHAEQGFLLFRGFESLAEGAHYIRYHHRRWDERAWSEGLEQAVVVGSQVLELADRVEILYERGKPILTQNARIQAVVHANSGSMFMPEAVDAFLSASGPDEFWLDGFSRPVSESLVAEATGVTATLDAKELVALAELFSQVIDFRSPYTCAHSRGVAAAAEMLADAFGFRADEARDIILASYLHDVGKLAVPVETLDKSAPLTSPEVDVIRDHPGHTHAVLNRVPGLEEVSIFASMHHERLDGSGYPFQAKGQQIPMAARLVAVADVFTAMTESRPYRCALTRGTAERSLMSLASDGLLDKRIVGEALAHFDSIDGNRQAAQIRGMQCYRACSLRAGDRS